MVELAFPVQKRLKRKWGEDKRIKKRVEVIGLHEMQQL